MPKNSAFIASAAAQGAMNAEKFGIHGTGANTKPLPGRKKNYDCPIHIQICYPGSDSLA